MRKEEVLPPFTVFGRKLFLNFATHPNIASVLEDANAKKYVTASPLYVK